MIAKHDPFRHHASGIRIHCAMIDGLSSDERKQLIAALIDPGAIIDLDDFTRPDATDRFGPIPADLPEPETAWFSAQMQREDGIKPNACDAESISTQITPAQREDLSTRHQFARFMARTLIDRCEARPDADQARAILRWLNHADTIKQRLHSYMLPLAVWAARRFRSRLVDFADRVSITCEALLLAIDKHDPRKASLSHFAHVGMHKRLLNRYNRGKRWQREWITGANTTDEGDDRTERKQAPESGRDVEALLDLDRILAEPGLLDERERLVIRYRFGLRVDHGLGEHQAERLSLEEAGQRLGITRERIRQIENGALEKLRCRFTSQPIPTVAQDLAALVTARRRGKLPAVADVLEGLV